MNTQEKWVEYQVYFDVPPIGLNSHIYIGNEAKYAGFAVNRPNATMPDTQGNPKTYDSMEKDIS